MKQFLRNVYRMWQYAKWDKAGKPLPPNSYVKQYIVRQHFEKSGHSTFIETGTLHGRMTLALSDVAKKIYSIELNKDYVAAAKKLFAKKKHITILEGDSGTELSNLLNDLKEPAFFWLDAHYSGGTTAQGDKLTPILEELKALLRHPIKKHTIWIDDMRCFDGTNDYPTLQKIANLVGKQYAVAKTDFDTIVLQPKRK